jgi:hypothetical protein
MADITQKRDSTEADIDPVAAAKILDLWPLAEPLGLGRPRTIEY